MEKKRKEKEWAEKQRLQDERFNREVRDPEVARCAQLSERRRESGGGGVCYAKYCDDRQDYCVRAHDSRCSPASSYACAPFYCPADLLA